MAYLSRRIEPAANRAAAKRNQATGEGSELEDPRVLQEERAPFGQEGRKPGEDVALVVHGGFEKIGIERHPCGDGWMKFVENSPDLILVHHVILPYKADFQQFEATDEFHFIINSIKGI